jgi:hypothetical protein
MDITRTIHDKMRQERLLFVYRGEVTEKNSLPLLTLLENEMKQDAFGLTGRKRLFMYVLENLQNIVKHGDHSGPGGMSLVTYSKTDDGYTITTGNAISAEHVKDLKYRLDLVNKLDIDEIKAIYRQILDTSEFSKKGGAGLGLFEMAIKTGNRLDYEFVPVDNKFSYFILSKTVGSNGVGLNSGNRDMQFESDSVVQLEHLMDENKIYLIWSGHINPGIGDEVLSLTEAKLTEEDIESTLRRRVFNIMIEILENVSKYNPGKEAEEKYGMPVAIIRFEDARFVLTTGNLILNSKVGELKVKLDKINSFGKDDLKTLFFESLSAQSIDTDSTGNMGLISMARKSGSKLNYQFEKVNDLYSYFMLTVKVEDNHG